MDKADWNRRYSERALIWGEAPNRTLAGEVSDLAPGRALDIACGEGRNAVWLAQGGWRVTAVDFSEAGVDKGRQRAAASGVTVEWIVADVVRYVPPADGFDLVVVAFLHLIEHERRTVLQHAVRALAPGGTFLYVGHDLRNLEGGHGGPQDPAVLCTAQDVVVDLGGLQIEKAGIVERPVHLEPGHGGEAQAVALDTLVRARRSQQNR